MSGGARRGSPASSALSLLLLVAPLLAFAPAALASVPRGTAALSSRSLVADVDVLATSPLEHNDRAAFRVFAGDELGDAHVLVFELGYPETRVGGLGLPDEARVWAESSLRLEAPWACDERSGGKASGSGEFRIFDPAGSSRSTSAFGWNRLFQGREYIGVVDAYDFRARTLWPEIGRFGQEDPAGTGDSPNRYQGFWGNWTTFTDPVGREVTRIGWNYRIEGLINGERVIYVGSAADLRARFPEHQWKQLMEQESTTVSARPVRGQLDIGASRRGTFMGARNEALRAPEEFALRQAKAEEAAGGPRVLNKIRAARKAELYATRHGVEVDGWRVIKKVGGGLGFPALMIATTAMDAYNASIEEKLGQYGWAPYVLIDKGGVFTLQEETRWFVLHSYYKVYVSGAQNGQKVAVTSEEYEGLRMEAEALWGTTRRGEFVPGLLNPALPTRDVM